MTEKRRYRRNLSLTFTQENRVIQQAKIAGILHKAKSVKADAQFVKPDLKQLADKIYERMTQK